MIVQILILHEYTVYKQKQKAPLPTGLEKKHTNNYTYNLSKPSRSMKTDDTNHTKLESRYTCTHIHTSILRGVLNNGWRLREEVPKGV